MDTKYNKNAVNIDFSILMSNTLRHHHRHTFQLKTVAVRGIEQEVSTEQNSIQWHRSWGERKERP